jgi:hypothetical protein
MWEKLIQITIVYIQIHYQFELRGQLKTHFPIRFQKD